MESSQILGFFKIMSESIKVVLKNAILIASLTTLSITLASIVFLLFDFSYQTVSSYMIDALTDSISAISFLQIIICLALSFAIPFTFMLSHIAITHVLGFATVIATATSYTGGSKLSLPDLFSTVRKKWTSPFRFRKSIHGSTRSRNPMHFLALVAVAVAVPVVVLNPNPVTIAIASAVGVLIFVFQLYASVASEVAAVIRVVEDVCEAAEAVEKAEKLVEGLRVQGLMVSVLFNIVDLIVVLSLWMSVGDLGRLSLNVSVYVLIYFNCASATRIFVNVAYTVYYFRCKEYYHGDKMQLFGNLNHTALLHHTP